VTIPHMEDGRLWKLESAVNDRGKWWTGKSIQDEQIEACTDTPLGHVGTVLPGGTDLSRSPQARQRAVC
jgi:hypothetical protein